MAHILPAIKLDTSIPGEIDFAKRLQNDPTCQDWWVLHSYRVPTHVSQGEGEIDFIVFIPNRGVVVVEVKSSPYIKVKLGEFYYTRREELGKNPFTQGQENMYSLQNIIKKSGETPKKFHQMVFTHVVITPRAKFKYETEEWESWKLCDKDIYHSKPLSTFLLEAIEQQAEKDSDKRNFREENACNPANIVKCISILRPEYENDIESFKERAERIYSEIKEFTPEQKSVLQTAKNQERLLVKGPAGTGKTSLAIELALSNAEDKEKVLFLCYNTGLRDYLSIKYSHENLEIKTFDQLMVKVSELSVPKNAHDEWYKTTLLDVASEKIIEKEIQYDYLIIDEFQDLASDENLIILDMLLVGGLKAGKWHIFGDFEKQILYNNITDPESALDRYLGQSVFSFYLRVNCRNTFNIVKMIENHISIEPYYQIIRPDGEITPTRAQYKDDNEQLANLERNIENLLKIYEKNEIIILSPKKAGIVNIYNEKNKNKKIEQYDFSLTEQNKSGPYYSTIKSFKGLEYHVVVVVDISIENFIDLTDMTNQLYTGLSRALDTTSLHINEQAIELLNNDR